MLDTYTELLKEMRRRPGLYLYEVSLIRLEIFIQGYSIALRSHNIARAENDFDFTDFTRWVQAKYPDAPRNQNWAFAIFEQVPDQESAFHKFFELYDEYNSQKLQIAGLYHQVG